MSLCLKNWNTLCDRLQEIVSKAKFNSMLMK